MLLQMALLSKLCAKIKEKSTLFKQMFLHGQLALYMERSSMESRTNFFRANATSPSRGEVVRGHSVLSRGHSVSRRGHSVSSRVVASLQPLLTFGLEP